jgi:hypothetical protein
MPKTPAYAFRKDQERDGDDNSASTRISPGVGIESVTRVGVLACAGIEQRMMGAQIARK